MGFRKDQYLDLFYLACTPTPLGNMIRNHGLDFHIYADDTQVYISFKPGDSVSRQTAKMSSTNYIPLVKSGHILTNPRLRTL